MPPVTPFAPETPRSPQTPRDRAPRERGILGPLVVLGLLLLLLLARVLLPRLFEPQRVPAEPSATEARPTGVQAFAGEAQVRGVGRLRVHLGPLHADERRQDFDARALQGELGLGPGEPWRLDLGLEPVHEGSGGRPLASGTSDAPAAILGLGIHAVRVLDSRGLALEPLSELPDPTGAPRPLVTLLRPPAGGLFPGEEVSVVLWGRAPAGEVQLAGLAPDAQLVLIPVEDAPSERPLARWVRDDRELWMPDLGARGDK